MQKSSQTRALRQVVWEGGWRGDRVTGARSRVFCRRTSLLALGFEAWRSHILCLWCAVLYSESRLLTLALVESIFSEIPCETNSQSNWESRCVCRPKAPINFGTERLLYSTVLCCTVLSSAAGNNTLHTKAGRRTGSTYEVFPKWVNMYWTVYNVHVHTRIKSRFLYSSHVYRNFSLRVHILYSKCLKSNISQLCTPAAQEWRPAAIINHLVYFKRHSWEKFNIQIFRFSIIYLVFLCHTIFASNGGGTVQ